MSRELNHEKYPIDVGPIAIDPYRHGLDPGEVYLSFARFQSVSWSERNPIELGEWAQEFAIEVIIAEEDLPILPPGKWQRMSTGQKWGPYENRAYYIKPDAFIEHYPAMRAFGHGFPPLLEKVLSDVLEEAHIATTHVTDSAAPDSLPGAFCTPLLLSKLVRSGVVLSFKDFQNAGERIRTSPAKSAEVFGKLVEILGDEKGRKSINDLKTTRDHDRRKWIREDLYIKTESLVELLLSCDERIDIAGFTKREWALLRRILDDRYATLHRKD
jgi:hypothetical protein